MNTKNLAQMRGFLLTTFNQTSSYLMTAFTGMIFGVFGQFNC